MSTDPEDIQRLQRRAHDVAAQDAFHSLAIDASDRALVTLLESVLDVASPAHRAISSVTDFGAHRGLLIIARETGGIWWMDDPLQPYLGKAEADGTLTSLDPDNIVLLFGGDGVIEAIERISKAIDAQLSGNKRARTEKILQRAEQIRALATLARGVA